MIKTVTFLIWLLAPLFIWGQNTAIPFQQAYQNYPAVPRGVLETVSWTRTHMQNINESYAASCTGMPKPYGVMGVFDDGANYFKENGKLIAQLSGISVEQQKASISSQVNAYAAAFELLFLQNGTLTENERIYHAFIQMSEIPDSGKVNLYARDAQVFEMMRFLKDVNFAQQNGFQAHALNLEFVFGVENLEVLSSNQVNFTENGIENSAGTPFSNEGGITPKSVGYGPALWVATPSCNYNSRNGVTVEAITIHTIQGSYAGAISWAQNCSANVSYHYVIRSSDGQITQMLEEHQRGWHVGNSNSIAIGFEHEGWIDQSSWYTEAMYQSSAALSKHITTKNHDADLKPIRTFYGAATTGTNTLGACTRIKGHQHFPSQSHTDPGIYWNWEKYFKLVNSNPAVTNITATSGNFYDTGGAAGNYANDERKLWLFSPAATSSVTLNFTSFDVEQDWDNLFIYDGNSTNSPLIGKYTGTSGPGIVTSTSGNILVEFRSDCATTKPGWAVTYSSVPTTTVDVTAPTTAISNTNGWKTQNFQVNFSDQDNVNGSGIEKSLYHAGYLSNGIWTANSSRGFIFDGFDGTTLNPQWTVAAGNWSLNSGKLKQTNASLQNNNVYMSLDQSLSNNYMYHWKGKFGGAVGNRRGGLYVLCSDPTGIERGNSYFIWFRVDDNKVQFYKVQNNNFGSPLISVPFTLNADVAYDFKFSFDRISGKMQVYIDDQLIGTYVDPTPYTTGAHVSFRSADATMEVDDFTVYRSRNTSENILVGASVGNDLREQNPNPTTSAGRIISIVKDNAFNLSDIQEEKVDVDWSSPQDLTVNDGVALDIDSVYQPTLLANWATTNDSHSGITKYEVAIGTTADGTDVLPWTANGLNTAISHLLINPIYDQVYFISVKAKNNAGLIATSSSNGQRYVDGNLAATALELESISIYPNPTKDVVIFQNLKSKTKVVILDANGKTVLDEVLEMNNNQIDVQNFATGSYQVILQVENQVIVKKLIKL